MLNGFLILFFCFVFSFLLGAVMTLLLLKRYNLISFESLSQKFLMQYLNKNIPKNTKREKSKNRNNLLKDKYIDAEYIEITKNTK